MKILVTGSNGQLGSTLKELAVNHANWQFIFTDIDELDLCNAEQARSFIANIKPKYIINCAAYTAVDKAESEKEVARKINAEVPEMLARLSEEYKIRLIHISTDYVFSGEFFKPLNESDLTAPPSVYGKTKLEGEKLVEKHTDAIIIRTSWLYSEYGNNFVKSMLRLGAEKEQLGVVFDQIGTPTSASDLARSILEIITFSENKSWKGGIYHFSNEGVCSWYDFAIEIMELGKLNCHVLPIESHEYPVPAPRPAFSVLNKSKIKSTFGIIIPFWKNSLKVTLNKLTNINK